MRRGEKEIKNRQEIDAIIRGCKVFRLGLCDGDEPYIVPLCFGYDGKALYSEKAFTFPEKRIEHICIVKVNIDQISGKQSVA